MIGFTSVSLRSYTIEEVVAIAEKSGAEIIEWGSDFHIKTEVDAEKAKKLCDKIGLKINSYGTYYRTGCFDKNEWEMICRIADIMNAKYIRAWLGTKGSSETSKEEYSMLIKDALNMADTAEKYGLTICHECHHHTFNDTTEASLRFLNDVKKDNIRTYYQSWYHDEIGDRDKFNRLFSYVQDVHISFSELVKFQKGYKKDEKYIEKILSWLKALDFSNNIIIEFTEHNNDIDLINDVKKLKAMWES